MLLSKNPPVIVSSAIRVLSTYYFIFLLFRSLWYMYRLGTQVPICYVLFFRKTNHAKFIYSKFSFYQHTLKCTSLHTLFNRIKLVLGKEKQHISCYAWQERKNQHLLRKISSKQTTHVSILQFCLLFAFYTVVQTVREGREVDINKERKRDSLYSFGFLQIASVCKFPCYTHHRKNRTSIYTQICSIHIDEVILLASCV